MIGTPPPCDCVTIPAGIRVEVIGRENELAAVAAFLDAVPDGPSAFLLEGEAGIGKTTVWQAGLDAAVGRSFRVLAHRAVWSETQLSLAGLADLLASVPEEVFARLPEPQHRAIGVALLAEEPAGIGPDWRAVSVAVLGVLGSLADSGPVLLAIDDIQWLDPSSARVLAFVCRRLDTLPIGVLASARGSVDDSPPLALDRALPRERLHRLAVAPLDLPALDRIIHMHLGASLFRRTLREIHRTSGGNPFFAIELALALRRRGGELGPGEPLPIPRTLQELVRERLGGLPDSARDVLGFVSALSHPTVPFVQAAVGRDERARVGLARAGKAGMIDIESDEIRFTHPLLASGVYSDLAPDRRRSVHRRLAEVATDPDERVRHLALCTDPPDPEVAEALERAASNARRRGAPDAAAMLFERSLRFTPDDSPEDCRRRRLEAALSHRLSRNLSRARKLLEELVGLTPPGRDRAEALIELADVRLEDSVPAATELGGRALVDAGNDWRLRASIHDRLSIAWWLRGDVAASDAHARAALDAAERSSDPVLIARAQLDVAWCDSVLGRGVPKEFLDRLRAVDSVWGDELPSFIPGACLMWADDLSGARRYQQWMLDFWTERGAPRGTAEALLQLSDIELRAGNSRESARLAHQAYDLVRDEGGWFASGTLRRRAEAEARLGWIDSAREAAAEAVELAERTGIPSFGAPSLGVLGSLQLSLGDFAGARQFLGRATSIVQGMRIGEPGLLRFVPDAIEAMVGVGELNEAKSVHAWFDERARALERPWAAAASLRCRGLLLASLGDATGAIESLEEALAHHERIPDQPFELARTLLVRGEIQRRARQKRAARASLQEAAELFERTEAVLWSERARTELRRIGGRAPAPLGLTPTEQRVAESVAAGRTNREVAAALFMSVRTVDGNLKRIYRKLNLRSRTELAGWVAEHRSAPGA